jgi:protein phosphatase PTC7
MAWKFAATEDFHVGTEDFALDSWGICRGEASKKGEIPAQLWRGDPFSMMDCGEDSFLLSSYVIGVADGVGGYRDLKVNSGYFSNKLMENAKALAEKAKVRDPKELLSLAYDKIVQNNEVSRGGTTACIASFLPNGLLKVANLGDSGVMVIRDEKCVFQNTEDRTNNTQGFNCPMQLSIPPRYTRPAHSMTDEFKLQLGDIVILGSDGLFDNLFPDEIARIASLASNDYMGPSSQCLTTVKEAAKLLEKEAYNASRHKTRDTPFSRAAQAVYGKHAWTGGKKDDITVVMAKVIPRKTKLSYLAERLKQSYELK